MDSKPVIVLGMHRSGTSLLAHLVHAAGVSAGDSKDLRPASKANQDGFWEKRQVAEFSDALLEAAGASWVTPPGSAAATAALAADDRYLAEAYCLMNSMSSPDRAWVWKDPKLSLLLPFWRDLLEDPVYIVAIRNPASIALSLKRRDGIPISAALLLWQVYLTSILRDLPRDANVLFVAYEQLLSSPHAVCSRLIEFLRAASRIPADGSVGAGQLCSFVRDSLCHAGAGARDLSLLDDAQIGLYAFLTAIVEGKAAVKEFAPDRYPIYPGWREYLQLWEGVFSFALQEDRRRFRLTPESHASRRLRHLAARER